MKICLVLGTRPEIIKMAPVVRELKTRGLDHYVVHTGQHYSYEMDRVFFKDLELQDAKYNLNVGSGTHGKQTAAILAGVEKVLMQERPDVVLVQGDTNTVLAGALAAAKMGIDIGHVEAGLRSYDRRMPEEINRVMADHISDILYPPTERSRSNLLAEGISSEKMVVTGNTVVDAVIQNLEISRRRSKILEALELRSDAYILATAHRQENVDDKRRMWAIVEGLKNASNESGLPVIFPIHPRTRKNIESFGIVLPEEIRPVEPLGYLDFLQLEANARLLMTDSGGVQEEGCILHVPCVTMRGSTERPETVEVGANTLAGIDAVAMAEAAGQMLMKKRDWPNPLGDGMAAKRIVEDLMQRYF
ncbi:MAG: UDP-N-acetylglucosamine 2-epimerase (non-hydrolyzing) [Methanomassiliicoccales archaeon]|nr:MAG: UDP-N-acetylglucosamine 2-epimerase (non-hydrolyzing) [Methanomassiliicoccales archaeon]